MLAHALHGLRSAPRGDAKSLAGPPLGGVVRCSKIQRGSIFREPHILCVVGSIGSGKSATSRLFAEQFGYETVNSGAVLAGLLSIPPIPETTRAEFQQQAEAFICDSNGPSRLGAALASVASVTGSERILIDGIRHPETLEALRSNSAKPIALLYVYTPPDVAYEMYRYREGHNEQSITLADFIKLYTAPVESRIRYMVGDADIITFNWLGLKAYERSISSLMEELHAD